MLDSIETILQFADTMSLKGIHLVVELVTTVYQSGVKLSKEAMESFESQLTDQMDLASGLSTSF